MEVYVSERRNSPRHLLRTALRVHACKCEWDERRAESENLSEIGTFFATDAPIVGRFGGRNPSENAEEISGNPTTEWRCTGHVVRVEPADTPRGKVGVGVQFDCFEILQS